MFVNWPENKPNKEPYLRGNLCDENKERLRELTKGFTKDDIIIELGSFFGLSAKFFMENTKAQLMAVDHFKGNVEHQKNDKLKPFLEDMFDIFCINLWDYRQRIQIFKMTTDQFFAGINKNLNVKLIYIDASHDAKSVFNDVKNSLFTFSKAKICGDDFLWGSVKAGLNGIIEEHGDLFYHIQSTDNFWEIIK